jgi:hypothetical protein
MRLLLILHEDPTGSFDDWRCALLTQKALGSLDDYAVYPFRARLRSGASIQVIAEEIIAIALDLEATAILWCHTDSLEVSATNISRLRGLPSRPVLGYWEGDMYQWPYKTFQDASRRIACASDVVFVPGYSSFTKGLRRIGCRDVRYVPLTTSEARFGDAIGLRKDTTEFDVVMVGGCHMSRAPLKSMPGARQRVRLVRLFEKKLGRRFAVFGRGWKGKCAQGPIRYREQGQAYAMGRISLGNNNLHAAYYFSDRLPIAMTCGSLQVHNWEHGFDSVLGESPPLRFFRDTEDAWLAARRLLETSDADIQQEGSYAREIALGRFTLTHVQRYMIDVLSELWQSRLVGTVPQSVANPWLGHTSLRNGSYVQ